MSDRRRFLRSVAIALLPPLPLAHAETPRRPARIGFLGALTRAAISDRIEALREGLRELGYVEGRNLVIEFKWAEGRLERLPALATELVRAKVDLIVTGGPAATRPAVAATRTIPIVMAMDNDPVAAGFVASLSRPGGNVTGVSTLVPALSGKQLEILREVLPGLARVAVIGESGEPGNAGQLKEAERAAEGFGMQLVHADVRDAKDIEPAVRTVVAAKAGAVVVLTGPLLTFQRAKVAELALRNRLPSIFAHPDAVRNGGLLTYGVNIADLFSRAAGYVDRILKGAKPGELAIEQPTKFELLVNLGTAKTLGVTIPQSLLLRADEVIQ